MPCQVEKHGRKARLQFRGAGFSLVFVVQASACLAARGRKEGAGVLPEDGDGDRWEFGPFRSEKIRKRPMEAATGRETMRAGNNADGKIRNEGWK
jgi:hypothetical protein